MNNKKSLNKIKALKKILFILSLVIVASIIVGGIHLFNKFGADPLAWVEYLRSFGAYSWVVLLLFQVLQVFVAVIPGEIIEIVSGLLFSPIMACILCYFGVFLATSLVFFIIRKMGKKFSRAFVSEEKLKTLRFINTKERLKTSAFILFLIPGTPKDLLSYFFALTPLKFWDFTITTMIARFPSVISSVVGGRYVGKGEYFKATAIFILTALVSLLGVLIYKYIQKKLNIRNDKRNRRLKPVDSKFFLAIEHLKSKKRISAIKHILKSKRVRITSLRIRILGKKTKYKPTGVLNIPSSLSKRVNEEII